MLWPLKDKRVPSGARSSLINHGWNVQPKYWCYSLNILYDFEKLVFRLSTKWVRSKLGTSMALNGKSHTTFGLPLTMTDSSDVTETVQESETHLHYSQRRSISHHNGHFHESPWPSHVCNDNTRPRVVDLVFWVWILRPVTDRNFSKWLIHWWIF